MAKGIRVNYLYRDAGNYKQHGETVFSNSSSLSIKQIRDRICSNLIDGEFFIAKYWNLPELFFDEPNEDDHGWHEFESIEVTDEQGGVDIKTLLNRVCAAEIKN